MILTNGENTYETKDAVIIDALKRNGYEEKKATKKATKEEG